VVDRLQGCDAVTMAMDGWTNVGGNKVINLVPVGGGVAYYWKSVVMKGFCATTDQHLPVAGELDDIMGSGVRIIAITTDNESVNGALHDHFFPTIPSSITSHVQLTLCSCV
jgi:hypothetical protein